MGARLQLAASLSLLVGIGCLPSMDMPAGDDDDTTPDTRTARQRFDQDVQPVMQAKCSTCHSEVAGNPNLLGSSPTAYYSTLENYTSNTCIQGTKCLLSVGPDSILVTKGAHAQVVNPDLTLEEGWWSSAELVRVKEWLAVEKEDRKDDPSTVDPCDLNPTADGCTPPGPQKPATAEEAYTRFGNCMTLLRDQWAAREPSPGPGVTALEGDDPENDEIVVAYNISYQLTQTGRCYTCHQATEIPNQPGQYACTGGACLVMESELNFELHRVMPTLSKIILPKFSPAGFADLQPANRYVDKGEDGVGTGHPNYLLPIEASEAMDVFVTDVLALYHDYANPCTPVPPPAGEPPPGP